MSSKRRPVRYAVHPAVAMSQAIIANVPEKTGRSIEQWVEILERGGPSERTARLRWLETEHGLGGGTSRLIVDRAEGNVAEYTDEQAYLAAAPRFVDDLYAGPKASLRPLHDTLVEHALALGDDVKISPVKTMVTVCRNHVFAQLKPSTKTRLDLGLALKGVRRRLPKRLIDTGGLEKGDRITHRIPISCAAEIDAEVAEWLRQAYELDT